MKRQRKNRRTVRVYLLGALIFGLLFAFAATAQAEGPSATDEDTNASAASVEQAVQPNVRYTMDFSYLHEVAPDGVAWLYQPDTSINHPVMLTTNRRYYLRRQFSGRLDADGAIFMLGTEPPDFSADVTTLYGKNCTDCTLFGSLSNYRQEEYYQSHPTFYLITPDGNYQLDVFAGVRLKYQDDAWLVSDDASTRYKEDLPRLLEQSFLTAQPELLPTEQDAWAVLSTDSYEQQGNRYVIYARKRPLVEDADAPLVSLNEMEMDFRETGNGRAEVEGVGSWMLYAQNDPVWDRLVFECETSNRRRIFGDGGCGPTAIAIAIANLVDKEELSKISAYASAPFGYRFCTCSVNEYWCSGKHLPYRLETADEYLRYFPLVIANFATGNNVWGVQGRTKAFGTNVRYLDKLCEIYGLSYVQTYQLGEAIDFLRQDGTIAIACTTGRYSPFTSSSHFLVLAHADDEYLYVLDPLRRTNYSKLDPQNYLEIITPGLVRIKLENAPMCGFAPIYLMQRAQ